MSDETRDATVRLSADVDPYRRDVAAAAEDTNKLAAAVDKLSMKLDGISKRAGKKLLLFGGAGAAGIAGIAAEATQFEKQLSVLNATTAVTDKTMGGFKRNITDLTKQFPVSRGEATELIKTLDKLGIQSHESMEKISASMVKLSAATGESLTGLTTGMVELGRQMGTINSGTMDQFANTLLTLSKTAGVSSQQVLNFASSIAPAARAAGMSEQAVLGVSTAFTKAGQDGFAAATTFNTMVADITRLVSTGSPEIAKYSNLIGVTADQFKQMDSAQQLSSIFEAINKQGPDAIRTLDRLGFDGVRIQRAIQGTSQSGGLAAAIAEATGAYASGTSNLDSASGKAMGGMADELQRTANAFEMLATSAGTPFVQAFTPVVEIFADMLNTLGPLVDGFANLGAAMSGLGTIAILGAGAAMTMASKNFAIAAARTAIGPGRSLLGGVEAGRYQAAGVAPPMGSRAADAVGMYRSNQMRWWHLPFFMAGHGAGQAMGPMSPGGPSAWRQYGGPLLSSPMMLARTVANAQADFYRQARVPTYERNAPVMGGIGNIARAMRHPGDFMTGLRAGGTVPPRGAGAIRDPEEFGRAMRSGAKTAAERAAADRGAIPVTRQLATATGLASGALMKMYAQASMTTMATVGKGAFGAGKGLVGGLAGAMFGHPLVAGAAAIGGGIYFADKIHDENRKTMTQNLDEIPIARYNAALGIATDETVGFSRALKSATADLPKLQDLEDAKNISDAVKRLGTTPGRELTNPAVLDYGKGGGAAGLTNYLHMLGITDPAQMQLAQTDMFQAFGLKKAQNAVNQFFADRELEVPGGIDFNVLANQTTAMQGRRTTPWYKAGFLTAAAGPSPTASRMMAESTESLSRTYDQENKLYGTEYAGTRQLQGYSAFIGANLPSKRERDAANNDRNLLNAFGLASDNSPMGKIGISRSKYGRNATAAVARIEKDLFDGGDLDFGVEDINQMIKQLGNRANKPKARAQYFWNEVVAKSDNKKVQETLDQWREQGITPANMGEEDMRRLRYTSESDYTRRIKSIGPVGRGALQDDTILAALSKPGDTNAQIKGVQKLLDQVQSMGGSFAETDATLQQFKAKAQSATDDLYLLAEAAQQLNRVQRDSAMGYMSRSSRIGEAVSGFREVMAEDPSAKDHRERLEARKGELVAEKGETADWMRGMLQQLRDYEIQSTRIEEDRIRTIERSNRDFRISMSNAEDDYNTNRLRSQRDFGIQMAQAQEDFNIAMERNQASFNRSMARQAEDAAKDIFDPYHRVQVTQTSSMTTVLENLKEQNERIIAQRKQVAKLKDMGLNQEAIDTLGLMDPANSRQVDRLMRNAQNDQDAKANIQKINKQVGKRQDATKDLIQNPLNEDYRRAIEDNQRAVDEATSDFERSQKRASAAHGRMLGDMADNFEKMTNRAAAAHKRGLADMREEYQIQNDRVKEDMARMGEEIFGNFGTLWARVIKKLNKHLGPYATELVEKLEEIKEAAPEFFQDEKDLGRPQDSRPSARAREGRDGRGGKKRRGDDNRSKLNKGLPEISMPDLSPRLGFRSSGVDRHEVRDGRTVASRTTYKGTTSYDYSTNFTGPIMVEANDPNKLIKSLQEKARVKRLTRPSIAPPD